MFFGSKEVLGRFVVEIPRGISSKEAARLVGLANKTRSAITIACRGEVVDCKDIMGLLMLAAGSGSTLDIVAKGPDAKEAVQEIGILLEELVEEYISEQNEKQRLAEEKVAAQHRAKQFDEQWLEHPSIPGFSPSDICSEQNQVRSILLWPGRGIVDVIDESMAARISKLLTEAGLAVYYCPTSTTYASRLRPGFYAIVITSLQGIRAFIKSAYEKESRIQILVCSCIPYCGSGFRIGGIKGLRISAYLEEPNPEFDSCLRFAVQEVALPRYRLPAAKSEEWPVIFPSNSKCRLPED